MEEKADKILKDIIKSYKYDIEEENLVKTYSSLNIKILITLNDIMFDIREIIQKLNDYHEKVSENGVKTAKEKLQDFYKNCAEMNKKVDQEYEKNYPILWRLYDDYKKYDSFQNVKETYKKCSQTLIDNSIKIYIKYEKQTIIIKDEVNKIIKLFNIKINS